MRMTVSKSVSYAIIKQCFGMLLLLMSGFDVNLILLNVSFVFSYGLTPVLCCLYWRSHEFVHRSYIQCVRHACMHAHVYVDMLVYPTLVLCP